MATQAHPSKKVRSCERENYINLTMTTQSPPSKKLRSCDEPDLKIIVKYIDGAGKPLQKEYKEYAVVLARLSNFVDTALASGMKEEATREIVFEDTTPAVFELARKIEDDVSVSRSLSPSDALQVVSFYHKYDFPNGLKLCDIVLSDCMSQPSEQKTEEELELLSSAIAAAEELDLVKSKSSAVACIHASLDLDNYNPLKTGRIFTLEQMKKLHPFIKNANPILLPPFLQRLSDDERKSALLPRYAFDRFTDNQNYYKYY